MYGEMAYHVIKKKREIQMIAAGKISISREGAMWNILMR